MPGFRRRFPYWRKVPKVVEQPRNGLGVVQLPPVNHLFQFAGFIESGNNFLIVFGRSLARNAVRSQQQKHALLEKSGCREHIEEDSQFLGPVPRFFRQFPRCRRLWILAGLHSTRDQLQQELLGRMPVLLDHHDAPVWKDWQYHNRPGMRNHLALRPQTCRFDQLIPPQSKNRPLIKHFAAQHLRGLWSLCGILLRHERSLAKPCVPQCNRTLRFFHAAAALDALIRSPSLCPLWQSGSVGTLVYPVGACAGLIEVWTTAGAAPFRCKQEWLRYKEAIRLCLSLPFRAVSALDGLLIRSSSL